MKKIQEIWHFLTYDIWRITDNEVTHVKFFLYNIIKTIYLCIDRFVEDRIVSKASALTYSTLLAIVPIVAIVFAIARGFGFANLMEQQFYQGLEGNTETARTILTFVDTYLAEAKSGVFIGVGLVMLLWTVINLINNIEITFNRIWGVKKARTWYRMVTDYFSMLLLTPILIVLSAGISIFMSTTLKQMDNYVILAPVMKFLIRLIPYVLTWAMFTGLYIIMPNTRVKFKYALIGGVLAGSAYQAFQYLYIDGQIWVSRYNAIYGSFAALPMFLLWLQMSWTICLFGASLTYAGQNIQNFSFDKDTRNITRRYKDFITVLIMSLIVKRFVNGERAYTAEEISLENHIPIRLTRQTLDLLSSINFVSETPAEKKSEEVRFQPAFDVNQMNVALLFERIDQYGSENFKIDKEEEFSDEWKILERTREEYYERTSKILLKDL
jgi:membrane protein